MKSDRSPEDILPMRQKMTFSNRRLPDVLNVCDQAQLSMHIQL